MCAQSLTGHVCGLQVVNVPLPAWSALGDSKAKASYLLTAIKAASPASASKVGSLVKELEKPFDAFAE